MPHNIRPCPDDVQLAPLSVQIDLDQTTDQIVPTSIEIRKPGRIPDNYIPPLENGEFRKIEEAVKQAGAQGICQKDGSLFVTFDSNEIPEGIYRKIKLVNNQEKPNPIDSAFVFGMVLLTLKRHDSVEELLRATAQFLEGDQVERFMDALSSLGPKKDANTWKWVGMIFYNFSNQYPDDTKYKRMTLVALTKALDLQPNYRKIGMDVMVALLTVATELNELNVAFEYLNKTNILMGRNFNPWFKMSSADKLANPYTRELQALDRLLLVANDLPTRHKVNLLKSIIARSTVKDDDPKGSAGQGTPGSPSGTPPPSTPTGSTPASNKASASSEEDATFSLGSFDIREEEPPPISTTLPWRSAEIFHRRRRKSRGKAPASQITPGPTIPAYSPARPAGFTVNIPAGSACPLVP